MGERQRAYRFDFWGKKNMTRNGQNAQAIVELALILPLLLVLIVGALEFGRLWSTKIILTNAAREGAYYLSTHNTTTDCSASGGVISAPRSVNASQNEALSSGVTLGAGDVGISGGSCASGTSIKVTTTTTVKDLLILGFVGDIFHLTASNNTFTLHSSVEMMIQ